MPGLPLQRFLFAVIPLIRDFGSAAPPGVRRQREARFRRDREIVGPGTPGIIGIFRFPQEHRAAALVSVVIPDAEIIDVARNKMPYDAELPVHRTAVIVIRQLLHVHVVQIRVGILIGLGREFVKAVLFGDETEKSKFVIIAELGRERIARVDLLRCGRAAGTGQRGNRRKRRRGDQQGRAEQEGNEFFAVFHYI